MADYQKVHVEDVPRAELHDALGLSGAEISVNRLDKGESVPFVHRHGENEEIYFILSGEGRMVLDGETVPLSAFDALRVAPAVARRLFASDESGIVYLCIQVKEGSLERYTAQDATVL